MELRMRLFVANFGPFQNWGSLDSLLDGECGVSGVRYSHKKKETNQTTKQTNPKLRLKHRKW